MLILRQISTVIMWFLSQLRVKRLLYITSHDVTRFHLETRLCVIYISITVQRVTSSPNVVCYTFRTGRPRPLHCHQVGPEIRSLEAFKTWLELCIEVPAATVVSSLQRCIEYLDSFDTLHHCYSLQWSVASDHVEAFIPISKSFK